MAIEVPQGATEPAAGVSSLADDPWSIPNLTDPYPLFERMRDAGPAVWLEQYRVHSFTRFESVRGLTTPGRVVWAGLSVDVDED